MVGVADEELVERVRRGDGQAFHELVDRHRAWLTARCRRHLGGDAHAAEDVAQECLVALQRTVLGGDKPMRVRPWLSVVARNRCIDEARKARAVPTADVPDAAVFDPETGTEDPHLMRAWSALTGRHRTVLELRELGGMSYEEIAATLAVTAGAVETLLFRARSALRREYARAGGKVASMAPIQEAVAAASGQQGALSRLADGAGSGLDGLLSSASGAADLGGVDGALSGAGHDGPAAGWLTDLQARLAASPAFEPAVQAGSGGGGFGGRLRLVLAGLGVLLGTVSITVPAIDDTSSPSPEPPSATVPAAPSPPAADAPDAETPAAPVETRPPEAPAAGPPPEAPPTDAPSASVGGRLPIPVPAPVDDVTRPLSPVLDDARTTVTTVVEGATAPVDAVLGGLGRGG